MKKNNIFSGYNLLGNADFYYKHINVPKNIKNQITRRKNTNFFKNFFPEKNINNFSFFIYCISTVNNNYNLLIEAADIGKIENKDDILTPSLIVLYLSKKINSTNFCINFQYENLYYFYIFINKENKYTFKINPELFKDEKSFEDFINLNFSKIHIKKIPLYFIKFKKDDKIQEKILKNPCFEFKNFLNFNEQILNKKIIKKIKKQYKFAVISKNLKIRTKNFIWVNAVILLILTGLFFSFKSFIYSKKSQDIKKQINNIFFDNFKFSNPYPVQYLERKIQKTSQNTISDYKISDILSIISKANINKRINIVKISINNDLLEISGTGETLENINNFLNNLKKYSEYYSFFKKIKISQSEIIMEKNKNIFLFTISNEPEK